jgi:predicted TPR repeat methyltransferase
VFAAAHAALRPGGTLVFTLEALPDDAARDYRLTASGRYAHTRSGVAARLMGAGFAAPTIAPASPRFEGGKPVQGWLLTVRRD